MGDEYLGQEKGDVYIRLGRGTLRSLGNPCIYVVRTSLSDGVDYVALERETSIQNRRYYNYNPVYNSPSERLKGVLGGAKDECGEFVSTGGCKGKFFWM